MILMIGFVKVVDAQMNYGKVFYSTHKKMRMLVDTTKYDKETVNKLQNAFESQFQREYILEFNKTASIFSEQEKIDIRGKSNNIGGELYKNFNTKKYIHKKELLGKVFSIQDSIQTRKWTIVNETKRIGKYVCNKATLTYKVNDTTDAKVVAWFTYQIPISNGPALYDGLPGLILQLNDNNYTYLCTKIEFSMKEKKIKKPRGGKIVNQLAFDKVLEKKKKAGKDRARQHFMEIESSKN